MASSRGKSKGAKSPSTSDITYNVEAVLNDVKKKARTGREWTAQEVEIIYRGWNVSSKRRLCAAIHRDIANTSDKATIIFSECDGKNFQAVADIINDA